MSFPSTARGGEPVAGRYRLVREIGRGGMGAVWLAHDELLGRDVALKRLGLFPGHDSPDLERAEREARLAAQLSHPNVVTVFDLAVDGEERWLVMEYVEGTTLARLAASRGGLPEAEAETIVRQAAEALRVAHEAGIIHRDVKPSNLIVGDDGVTKLTDFGIARGVSDATLTQSGVLTGSPAYLAPEVAAGGTATAASDVWSLGGALYQAVTGRPPYDLGDNVVAGLLRIVREDPPRLPDSGRLGTVLAATMVRDPARRWTAAQVVGYLDGHLTEDTQPLLPVTAAFAPVTERTAVAAAPTRAAGGPPTTPPPSRPPATRSTRRATYWLVPALLAAAVAVGGWLLLRPGSDDPQAGTTVSRDPSPRSPTTAASSTGPTAEGMRRFVQSYLATVTRDPRAAWSMLTPQFQQESGGFGDYQHFWAPIRAATPSEITADPSTLTVAYHVTYDGAGRPEADDVRLRLHYEDGRYLVAGEPD